MLEADHFTKKIHYSIGCFAKSGSIAAYEVDEDTLKLVPPAAIDSIKVTTFKEIVDIAAVEWESDGMEEPAMCWREPMLELGVAKISFLADWEMINTGENTNPM